MLMRMVDLSKHDGLRTCEIQFVASADLSLYVCVRFGCLFLRHERHLSMSHTTNIRIKLFEEFFVFLKSYQVVCNGLCMMKSCYVRRKLFAECFY